LSEGVSGRTAVITHPGSQEGARAMYEKVEALTSQDIADVIAFAVGRPRRVAINEVLIRPSRQPL
jgi:NADP-dependent 3-hydroxy acid dehydrogenase YdfG